MVRVAGVPERWQKCAIEIRVDIQAVMPFFDVLDMVEMFGP